VAYADPVPAGRLSAASAELLELGDLDELTRHVNALVADRQWDELVALAARCRLAFERGKQLWAVAPTSSTASPWRLLVVGGDDAGSRGGRFAFGPLPEVAASTHGWGSCRPTSAPRHSRRWRPMSAW